LTDSRIFKYEAILLERYDLVFTTENYLNPVEILLRGKAQGFFVGGSFRAVQEKRHNGYLVVDGIKLRVIESGRLPNNWSTQTCELFTLNQVLKFLQDEEGMIYTDSTYAFGVVYTFGKMWAEKGLINSK
jgi:hypothetical protein